VYRFALRPLWLLSHGFALGLVLLFVVLGFWQLDRHDQKVDRNRTIEARTAVPATPVTDLLGPAGQGPGDALRYRQASAEGTYLAGADVLIDNRSNDGLPGASVVTPLRLEDGSVLAVSRGFQGFESGTIDPPDPPSGPVRVEGTLLPWDDRDCGVRSADDSEVVGTACLKRSVVEAEVGEPVLDAVLQRTVSSPEDAAVLVPVPLPDLDAGPHRSYAVQWFIFATIGLVGYPLILRRVARDRATGSVPAADPGQ
jgi:surfeit locus 1 family protein